MDEKFDSRFQAPVSQKLVDLIERNAGELTNNWLREVLKDESLPTFRSYDMRELYERAFDVFSRLGKWISRETTKEEIATHYMALGAQRRKEGFSLCEIIQALIHIRRQLWLKVMEEGMLDTILDLYQVIELNNRVTVFFDRAIYYVAAGYEKTK